MQYKKKNKNTLMYKPTLGNGIFNKSVSRCVNEEKSGVNHRPLNTEHPEIENEERKCLNTRTNRY